MPASWVVSRGDLVCQREVVGGLVPERSVRSFLVVVAAPVLDAEPRVGQGSKPMKVQAFVTKPPVEALGEGVLNRFAGLDVLHVDPMTGGPLQEVKAPELGAVVPQPGAVRRATSSE